MGWDGLSLALSETGRNTLAIVFMDSAFQYFSFLLDYRNELSDMQQRTKKSSPDEVNVTEVRVCSSKHKRLMCLNSLQLQGQKLQQDLAMQIL